MKSSRQNKIVEIIRKYNVETQEELADYLQEAGFAVTQATVSRDIRELKLTKVPTESGRSKYAIHQGATSALNDKLVRVLRDAFISMDRAQNILVIKTVSGMAMAAAAALDSLELSAIVGCIAGDDTIMCAIRTDEQTEEVMQVVSDLIYGK
ncbi:MAG: arginine repressor [Lachnospiraceae bacterium]|nr:arginine repressor [Lachnospiraceae bacterium]